MAFDVYVGTMTRFYRREWENVVQRMAREKGMQYNMVYAGGKPEPPQPADEIRQAVAAWCRALSAGLAAHGCIPLSWDEGDAQPYFTDRPGWEGYGALLVWAAHAEHPDLPIPNEVPDSWADDPAYLRSAARDSKTQFPTILEPNLWLPAEFPFVFEAPTLVSEKGTRIGSVFTLSKQLNDLYSQTAERLLRLKAAGVCKPPPVQSPGVLSRLFARKPPLNAPQKPPLAEAAEVGLQVFRDLAGKACEHQLPILLHF
jgi:hypothetical protein